MGVWGDKMMKKRGATSRKVLRIESDSGNMSSRYVLPHSKPRPQKKEVPRKTLAEDSLVKKPRDECAKH